LPSSLRSELLRAVQSRETAQCLMSRSTDRGRLRRTRQGQPHSSGCPPALSLQVHSVANLRERPRASGSDAGDLRSLTSPDGAWEGATGLRKESKGSESRGYSPPTSWVVPGGGREHNGGSESFLPRDQRREIAGRDAERSGTVVVPLARCVWCGKKSRRTEAASTFCGTCENGDGDEEGAAEGFAASGDDVRLRGPVVTRGPPAKCAQAGSAKSGVESLLKVEERRRQLGGQETRLDLPLDSPVGLLDFCAVFNSRLGLVDVL
jgi:hypothetical protein